MDLAPLKVFPSMHVIQPSMHRSGEGSPTPPRGMCFFCKESNCKNELCKIKHGFKQTVLGTCQMCYADDHWIVFESNEYELYNCMCSQHEQLILDQIVKSGRSIIV